MQNRREFIERVTAGAMLASIPFTPDVLRALEANAGTSHAAGEDDWDLSWVSRVTGTYRAVFDVPEIEGGAGVWRAALWKKQYGDVLKTPASELSAVVVLRHKAVILAMQQPFWDRYELAKKNEINDPITDKRTDRNPALLSSSRNEVPAEFDDVALDKFIAGGGIALACNLALQELTSTVKKVDKVSDDDARKTVLAGLVPGVIVQPSGVFAAIHAQDAGCKYLRAS